MSNEIATNPKANAAQIVKSMEVQWQKVLPKVCTPDRFARVVLSAINKDPVMIEALQHPTGKTSLLSAFMKCAEMGIEPDGRKAAVVVYKDRKNNGYNITLIPMFQGLAELVMRSGIVSYIHADKVCENDEFEWNLGKVVTHRVDFRKPRGNAYAYYCHVCFKDGTTKDEVMSREEVESIMKRSSAYQGAVKYGKECPWTTDFDEMAKKTVFRRCAKWLPLSPELRNAEEIDNLDFRTADENKAVEVVPAVGNAKAEALLGITKQDPVVDVMSESMVDAEEMPIDMEVKREEKQPLSGEQVSDVANNLFGN